MPYLMVLFYNSNMTRMSKKTVFLSGPIRGLPRDISLGWRKEATKELQENFEVIHALRGREDGETFGDPRAAVIRDLSDIRDSDLLLVNDSVKDSSMIGTSMEIFFAHSLGKPVVLFGDAHEKDYWLEYHSHLRVKTLKEACDVLNKMFV
jgi:nucleoside 2-deoxyribosyltransferase